MSDDPSQGPHRNWMPDSAHLALGEQEYPIPETFYDNFVGRPAGAAQDQNISGMFLTSDMKLHLDPAQETGTGGAPPGYDATKDWDRIYSRLTPQQREFWDAYYDPIIEEFKNDPPEGRALAEWKYQRYMNDYLKCIMSVDDNVGRVLDFLEAEDLMDNTLIVYTSDQGFYLGEHGWYDKRFMYEESFSMPLLMRYPPIIEPGSTSDHLVLNLDIAPTFMELLDIETNEPWQGRSLAPILQGEEILEWRTAVYYHYYEYPHGWHKVKRHYGIRTPRYKLIHFYHDIDHWELYDLEQDPQEVNNIYESAGEILIQDLKSKLMDLQQQYGDSIRLAL